MSWQDRIVEARYTSPSGEEAVFDVESVNRDTELKTGVYTFPDLDGAHVQHQGAGAKTFSITAIFSGESCMDDADAFEAMLVERGVGSLQHPVYGTLQVVPTGSISREDNLVSALNQSTVKVTFTETITDESAETMTPVAAADLEEKYEAMAAAAAADFAEAMVVDNISEQLAIQSALEAQAELVTDNLESLVEGNASALGGAIDASGDITAADFQSGIKELKEAIKNLYKETLNAAGKAESTFNKALSIARLTLRLTKLPGRIATNLALKIAGYTGLVDGIIGQFKNDPFGAEKTKNAYSIAWLGLAGTVASIASGAAVSIMETASGADSISALTIDFDRSAGVMTRKEALETANKAAALLDKITAFADSKTAQNVFVDSNSETYLSLVDVVQTSVQIVLNASFSLAMERTITLGRDRQPVELVSELYGSPDYLDRFIVDNDLNIDEIELLPMGRKVSYYVASS